MGSQNGTIIFIDTRVPEIAWTRDVSQSRITSLNIVNLEASHSVGLFVGDLVGVARCYTLNASFDLLWNYTLGDKIMHDIAMGDLDGDLIPEIITGTTSSIFCISSSGTIMWNSSVYGSFGDTNPLLVDFDRDGKLNLIFYSTSFKGFYCIDMSTFSLLWSRSSYATSKIAICDVNLDGTFELVSTLSSGVQIHYLLNETTGYFVEEYEYIEGFSMNSLTFSIYDLDSDGILELLVAGYIVGLKSYYCFISAWSLNCSSWGVPGPTACRGGSWLENCDFTDTDRDRLTDAMERCIGTNPFAIDTDFDTDDDYAEIMNGTNPLVPDTVPSVPRVLLHVHEAPVYSGLVNFSWNYTGDSATVDNYTLQVSTSCLFDTTVLSIPGIVPAPGTTSTNASLHFPTGCYFWRVGALNGNGTCEWSVPASFSFVLNDFAPSLVDCSVNPPSGNQTTLFTFTTVYFDLDNDYPTGVYVVFNGTAHAMVKQDPSDVYYVDGCNYACTICPLVPGNFTYRFESGDNKFSIQTPCEPLVVTETNEAAPGLSFTIENQGVVDVFVFTVT
nr:VCBS repeat-containing protein [Candidatus Sigynarchaeota archaeon]